jgi:hypothetical protein
MKSCEIKMSTVIQTDQFTCFDETGRQIPCKATGQDGELRCGIPWPKPRFLPKGDLVEDAVTGLSWIRDAGIFEFPMTWHEAHRSIAEMNRDQTSGYDDWRIPYRNEIFGLVSHTNINPALPAAHPFVNVFAGYYWTATPCARLPDQAWYVHLGGARVQRGIKQGSYMVWPVRGGKNPPVEATRDHRFQRVDETVFDRYTGLTWLENAVGMDRPVSWVEALAGAQSLNRSGAREHGDWRLPNIRELAGLLDMERHSPALHRNHPFRRIHPAYWSATTSTYDPRYAWTVEFRDGAVGVGYKPLAEFHAWYVRGAAKGKECI